MYIKMTLTHFIIYYGKSAEGMTHVFLVKKSDICINVAYIFLHLKLQLMELHDLMI